jgi:hypothetical protein
MKPLTLDDLLPLEEFASRRPELFQAHLRYLDRERRVRVGPRLTLVFENRQTLWFRVQEVLRVARLTESGRVQQVLDLYNQLLPTFGVLQAALLIGGDEGHHANGALDSFRDLRGDELHLHLGKERLPADLLTSRPEDRCFGAAHWVRFPLRASQARLLADRRSAAFLSASLPEYQFESAPFSEDLRLSLLDDLGGEGVDPPVR